MKPTREEHVARASQPDDDLALAEACRLLGGASSWRTHSAPSLAIPAMKVSDGPNGVRGEHTATMRTPGVVVPVGLALGATWDPGLVERLGGLLATEARRRNVHVLLAPTVNLVRLPIAGRAFECYSEDPELTARLAVGFVRGVQSGGVAATVKHFVANDSEIDRMTVDVRMDPAVLRELYLRPFEAVVREAGAWAVMSSYNRLDGELCGHYRWLLTDLLRDEWGFDGVVVSDWGGARDTVAAANAGLTLAMPGPVTVFGDALAQAVRDGAVSRHVIEARVGEMRFLADRTNAASTDLDAAQQLSVDDPAERALCRDAVTASMVLVRNERRAGVPALPILAGQRIAVIGPNAAATRIMGGGSSSLTPLPAPSILTALTERFGGSIVGSAAGVSIDRLASLLGPDVLRTPDGEPGLRVEIRTGAVFDAGTTVEPVVVGVTDTTMFVMTGDSTPGLDGEFTVTLVGSFVPQHDGEFEVGVVLAGAGRAEAGGVIVADDPERRLPRSDLMFGFGSEEQLARIECRAGVRVPVRVSSTGHGGAAALRLGIRAVEFGSPIDDAVALAGTSDVAVVVVGTNDEWETEGEDRTSLALPGAQDELVQRVAAVAPRTVVVVNAGGPIEMPWIDEVDGVVITAFAGIETGPAVAAVLAGDRDPGGRLPVTYPVRLEDSPAWPHYLPVDGVQRYDEGRHVGYRGFAASGVAPLFPFGHGLSYGTSVWRDVAVNAADARDGHGDAVVSVRVSNTGHRDVTDVVQVYVANPRPDVPPFTLAGFAKTVLGPGDERVVEVRLGEVAWRRWDTMSSRWTVDAGEREIIVARSATDHHTRLTFTPEVARP